MQLALTHPEGTFYQQLSHTPFAAPLTDESKAALSQHLSTIKEKIGHHAAANKALDKLSEALKCQGHDSSMASIYDLIETYRKSFRLIHFAFLEDSDQHTIFKAFDDRFNEAFTAPFLKQLKDLEHIDLTLRLDEEETVTLQNIENKRANNCDGEPFSLACAILALSAGRGQTEPDVPNHLSDWKDNQQQSYLSYNGVSSELVGKWEIIGDEIIKEYEAQFPERKELSDVIREQNHFGVGKAQCKAIYDKSIAALNDIGSVAEQLKMSSADKATFKENLEALQSLLEVDSAAKAKARG